MGLVNILKDPKNITDIIKDPLKAYMNYLGKNKKNELYQKYFELAKKANIDKLYFILSFDCDTQDDINVVNKLNNQLLEMGIEAVYAVPGQFLITGSDEYKEISCQGNRFINHGYFQHTFFDTKSKSHISTFFYNKMSDYSIYEDIKLGHETIHDILGYYPKGYRTPHFGHYQNKEQLSYLHSVLKKLSYEYSTSTNPYYGFTKGAIFNDFGLSEFPVSGSYDENQSINSLDIIDSWSFFAKLDRKYNKNDYKRIMNNTIDNFTSNENLGILNYYADPSHIHDSIEFFDVLEKIMSVAENTTYENLLEKKNIK